MKFGITRWKMVPSYSGVCLRSCVLGSTHSFLPVASPTKFATAFGVLSGNRAQVSFPAVVSKTAVSLPALVGLTCDLGEPAVSAASDADSNAVQKIAAIRIHLT